MPPRTVARRVVRRSDDEEQAQPEEESRPTGRRTAAVRRNIPQAQQKYDEVAPEGEEDDESDEDRKAERAARRKDVVKTGWAGAKATRAEVGDFPDNFQPTDEAQLCKCLDDEPFASYPQHWIEREGKKSWTCGKKVCPLCDIGDRPAVKNCFNLAVLEGDEWVNKVWTVGSRLTTTLENFARDEKVGPLSRGYFSIRKTGAGKGRKSGGSVNTVVNPVKERDVLEDWGVEPLDDDTMEELLKNRFDAESVPVHTKKQLKEIADEVFGEED